MNRLILILTLALATVAPVLSAEPPASAPAAKAAGFAGGAAAEKGLEGCTGPSGTVAQYVQKAHKTFFVFSGRVDASAKQPSVLASYFDHESGMLARPRIVAEQAAGQRAVMALDVDGHLWVFSPGAIYKGTGSYAIDSFERVGDGHFHAPQVWPLEGKGFLAVDKGEKRQLTYSDSKDGIQWSEPLTLAAIANGHDFVSGVFKNKIGVAFNVYTKEDAPAGTNVYYMETIDGGKTWMNAAKEKLELPLKEIENKARAFDYASSPWQVHMKDINFDTRGNPALLYLTDHGTASGPQNGPHVWSTARWYGRDWEISGLVQSDHYCDSGCLAVEERNLWRMFATTDPGAAPKWKPGGEVVMWQTDDFGRAWQRQMVTQGSPSLHRQLARPVNANLEFYVMWTDEMGKLYFANREGQAFAMPVEMSGDLVKPEALPSLAVRPPVESAPEK